MSASAVSLLGYIGWILLLSALLVSARMITSFTKGNALNSFSQDGSDLPGWGARVTRAHGNSLEWFAIPAALILYGMATGQSGITDGLAMIALYCRLGQSISHMISTAVPVVLIRATFFTVQLVIFGIWAWKFFNAA